MRPEFIIDKIQHHINRIEAILPEIESWMPLKVEDFSDTEKCKHSCIFKRSR